MKAVQVLQRTKINLMSIEFRNLHVHAGKSTPLVSFVLFVEGNNRVCPFNPVHCPPALQPFQKYGHKHISIDFFIFITEHVNNVALVFCSPECTSTQVRPLKGQYLKRQTQKYVGDHTSKGLHLTISSLDGACFGCTNLRAIPQVNFTLVLG